LRAATRADPTFSETWYNLSGLLDEQGRSEAAIDCLRRRYVIGWLRYFSGSARERLRIGAAIRASLARSFPSATAVIGRRRPSFLTAVAVFLKSGPPVPAGGRDRRRYGQCPRPLLLLPLSPRP
jgi:hypothetical protein